MHHEHRPHQLRWHEMGLCDEAAKGGGSPQAPHAPNRELSGAHRASKLAAPSASSKLATASPARSGMLRSMSADAVSCTAPSRSVTRPYNRPPVTTAATGA